MVLRAHFDGKVLIPVEPVDLPRNKLLEIDVREVEQELRPGSPAAVKKLMHELPHVSSDIVDEWERAIAQGNIPVRYEGVFDDLREEP